MQNQIELMEIGSIAIFAAYNLILFTQEKRRYYLYLGLLSFFILIRATLVDDGSMVFYSFFSDLSLTMGKKIEFFSSYIGYPLSVLFSYTVYPYAAVKKYIRGFVAISIIFLLTVLFTPYQVFYHTYGIYHFVILISYILMYTILIKAVRDKQVGSVYVLIGTVLCFLFVIAELFKISGVIFTNTEPNLVTSGFVIFLLFQSIALSEICASSSRKNHELNKNLQLSITEKTSEIYRSNLLRDTLIRIISHDIRGPMSNLKSLISLTREGQVGIDQAKEFLGTIDKGVDHTIQILDELMEWGYATSQNKRIKQEETVFKEVIDYVVNQMKSGIEAKNISFSMSGNLESVCFFDKNALKVVTRNLLSNAVKFTEKGGNVTLDVKKRSEDILIRFIDTGIGIPEEMKTNLFEMKKDNKRLGTENEKSSGIGLFICNDLITQNGGTLDVKDNSEGKGTVFSFTLNLAG